MSNNKIPKELQPWIEAKKKHRLSQMHIQMARELGMNPKSFGKLDNHKQEQWKVPLPQFIENLYMKRFGREAPASVLSFKEIAKSKIQKKAAAKERKVARRTTAASQDTENQQQNNLNQNFAHDIREKSLSHDIMQKGNFEGE